jgi:hypothetical protein
MNSGSKGFGPPTGSALIDKDLSRKSHLKEPEN